MEDVKIKLSALWAAGMLNGLMGGLLELMEPGYIEQIIAGEVEGIQITDELLLGFAILMVIPPVMVFLSLALPAKVNRWANIIFGIVFVGFGLFEIYEANSAYVVFGGIVTLVFSALVIWYAWKWGLNRKVSPNNHAVIVRNYNPSFLSCNIRYSLKQTIKEPVKCMQI